MAIGDSLSAGMQDATLDLDLQRKAFPALLAKQAGVPFQSPEIHDGAIPPRVFEPNDIPIARTAWRAAQVAAASAIPLGLATIGINPPGFTVAPLYYAGGIGRQKGSDDTNNFAVPGFELRHLHEVENVSDYTRGAADGEDAVASIVFEAPLIKAILQKGGRRSKGKSEVDLAIAKQPDLVTLWAGNNDILSSALSASVGDTNLTPFEDRKWLLNPGDENPKYTDRVIPGLTNSMVGPDGVLTRILDETDSHVMLMNVPDVTTIPHLLTVGERVGKLPFEVALPNGVDITRELENFRIPTGVRDAGEGERVEFPEGTRIGLGSLLGQFHRLFTQQGSDGLFESLQSQALLKEDDVLDPEEIGQIQAHTERFNDMLEDASENPRVHLVDVNHLLTEAKTKGVALKGAGEEVMVGAAYTGTKDGRGHEGIFSHDGIHPSDVGQAVVANLVLEAAKSQLGDNPRFQKLTQAPLVDEKAVLEADARQGDGRSRIVLGGPQLVQLRAGGADT